ncbi:MAG: hypothetical protein NT171_05695, partial [Planctomycetota bacterium]|nr:hypothetical protein [Planctomycetota bacterium]
MRPTGGFHMTELGGGRQAHSRQPATAASIRRRRNIKHRRARSAVGLDHAPLEPRQLMTGNDPADFGGRFQVLVDQ